MKRLLHEILGGVAIVHEEARQPDERRRLLAEQLDDEHVDVERAGSRADDVADRDRVGHEHRVAHRNGSGHRAYRRVGAANRVTSRPQRVCDGPAQGVVHRCLDASPLPPIHVRPCSHGSPRSLRARFRGLFVTRATAPASSVVLSALGERVVQDQGAV